MSEIASRVKAIIVDKLGVEESEVPLLWQLQWRTECTDPFSLPLYDRYISLHRSFSLRMRIGS